MPGVTVWRLPKTGTPALWRKDRLCRRGLNRRAARSTTIAILRLAAARIARENQGRGRYAL